MGSNPKSASDAPSIVQVSVHGLGGEEAVEVQAAPDTIVQALKEQIAGLLHGFPAAGQALVHDDVVLDDSESIGNLIQSGSCSLSLTLIKSSEVLEEAYKTLEARSTTQEEFLEKCSALEVIGAWYRVRAADERAIRAVVAQFAARSPLLSKARGASPVQRSAVETLRAITTRGDDVAIREVIAMLRGGAESQTIAFEALPAVAQEGDTRALTALYELMEEDHESVRVQAFLAIGQVAGRGNADTIAQLLQCLSHREPGVRESAARCLGQVARAEDESAVRGLEQAEGDPVGCVKRAAAQALAELRPHAPASGAAP